MLFKKVSFYEIFGEKQKSFTAKFYYNGLIFQAISSKLELLALFR